MHMPSGIKGGGLVVSVQCVSLPSRLGHSRKGQRPNQASNHIHWQEAGQFFLLPLIYHMKQQVALPSNLKTASGNPTSCPTPQMEHCELTAAMKVSATTVLSIMSFMILGIGTCVYICRVCFRGFFCEIMRR